MIYKTSYIVETDIEILAIFRHYFKVGFRAAEAVHISQEKNNFNILVSHEPIKKKLKILLKLFFLFYFCYKKLFFLQLILFMIQEQLNKSVAWYVVIKFWSEIPTILEKFISFYDLITWWILVQRISNVNSMCKNKLKILCLMFSFHSLKTLNLEFWVVSTHTVKIWDHLNKDW